MLGTGPIVILNYRRPVGNPYRRPGAACVHNGRQSKSGLGNAQLATTDLRQPRRPVEMPLAGMPLLHPAAAS